MGGEGGLYDQPLVIQGKRQRKTVESFSIEHEAKAVAKYDGGKGTKLGDIPYSMWYCDAMGDEHLVFFFFQLSNT